jgi:hypothetical protein
MGGEFFLKLKYWYIFYNWAKKLYPIIQEKLKVKRNLCFYFIKTVQVTDFDAHIFCFRNVKEWQKFLGGRLQPTTVTTKRNCPSR